VVSLSNLARESCPTEGAVYSRIAVLPKLSVVAKEEESKQICKSKDTNVRHIGHHVDELLTLVHRDKARAPWKEGNRLAPEESFCWPLVAQSAQASKVTHGT
jgi:hypothetical protein